MAIIICGTSLASSNKVKPLGSAPHAVPVLMKLKPFLVCIIPPELSTLVANWNSPSLSRVGSRRELIPLIQYPSGRTTLGDESAIVFLCFCYEYLVCVEG